MLRSIFLITVFGLLSGPLRAIVVASGGRLAVTAVKSAPKLVPVLLAATEAGCRYFASSRVANPTGTPLDANWLSPVCSRALMVALKSELRMILVNTFWIPRPVAGEKLPEGVIA